MRHATCPLLGVLLVVALTSTGSAEETKSHWWQFGAKNDAPSAPATVTPAPTMTPAPQITPPAEEESWFAWPSMPKLSWFNSGSEETTTRDPFAAPRPPEIVGQQPRTRFGKPVHRSQPRNAWAQQPASAKKDAGSSPWHSVTEGTRTAWRKTVDFVTPGSSVTDKPIASRAETYLVGTLVGRRRKARGAAYHHRMDGAGSTRSVALAGTRASVTMWPSGV